PLQFMVTGEAVARGHAYPEAAKDVNFNPVGQVVGQMNKVRRSSDLIMEMVEEYLEATGRLNELNARAGA
ncbi:MAG TPA: nitronate monooxygenase, partial [Microthrixaceae bacterium]|nr:nitronate monooxygenase [Microthrixaceae bacterium]